MVRLVCATPPPKGVLGYSEFDPSEFSDMGMPPLSIRALLLTFTTPSGFI